MLSYVGLFLFMPFVGKIVSRFGKKEAITVSVLEPMPGDWELLQQSHPSTKETSGTARFKVTVPAEGKATLTYRVRIRQ